MSSEEYRPFCLDLNVLTAISLTFVNGMPERGLNRLSIEYRISEELLVVKDEIKLLSHFENVPYKPYLIDTFGNALNKFEVNY